MNDNIEIIYIKQLDINKHFGLTLDYIPVKLYGSIKSEIGYIIEVEGIKHSDEFAYGFSMFNVTKLKDNSKIGVVQLSSKEDIWERFTADKLTQLKSILEVTDSDSIQIPLLSYKLKLMNAGLYANESTNKMLDMLPIFLLTNKSKNMYVDTKLYLKSLGILLII